MLKEEFAGGVRLPPQLRDPRVDVDEEIWILLQPAAHARQILGVVAKVSANERRGGVPRHHALELRQQLLARRKTPSEKQPVGMLVQLMPAFVLAIERREECRRVCRVNHDRPPMPGTHLPDGVERRIVNGHQRTVLAAHGKAQGLMNLQSLGAGLETCLQPCGFARTPAFAANALEVHLRKGEKAARMGLIEPLDGLAQPRAPATVEIHNCANARFIHLC